MKRFFVGAAMLVACAYACDDNPQSHVYVAALFDPVNGCFGPSKSLATIATPDGDLDCAPTCLVAPNGVDVYVSTMCGPYPPGFDSSQTNATCPTAIAAWPAEQTALANGSNSCASPAPPTDGGSDAGEGGDDASSDDGSATDDGGTTDGGADGTPAVDAADGGADAPAE